MKTKACTYENIGYCAKTAMKNENIDRFKAELAYFLRLQALELTEADCKAAEHAFNQGYREGY